MTTRPPLTPAEIVGECFRGMTVHNMEEVILDAVKTGIRQERQAHIAELREMAETLIADAAGGWPDDGHQAEYAAHDDALRLTAALLQNRADRLEREGAIP